MIYCLYQIEKEVITISTYYMENKAEMVEYAGKQTKSITVNKISKAFLTGTFEGYVVGLYTTDTPTPKGYGDSVYVNKRTLKAFLRHFTGLKGDVLNNELWALQSKWSEPLYKNTIWNKKVLIECDID